MRLRHPVTALAAVFLLTVPWTLLWLTGVTGRLSTAAVIPLTGVAIIGAAFLLTWAAETAERDVPREFAIAVLAVIAVAPEYAVDALYAWEAGRAPGTPESMAAADLAVANMTGANRILIGLGWSGIALYAVYRAVQGRKKSGEEPGISLRGGFLKEGADLDPRIALELLFIAVATAYAFLVPLNGGIDAVDAVFLVGLYMIYVYFVLQGESSHDVHLGVTGYLQRLPRRTRVAAVLALFVYSGFVILVAVKPFARGLEALGPQLGVSSFFMIQWVAPLASESPEFIATAYLVSKARSTAAFTTLISSKLNQWTLLIGTLVVVYSLSLGSYDVLHFSQRQAGEIWLTAAQSFFAVVLLIDFRISVREAFALLALFAVQFHPVFQTYRGLLAYSAVYMVLAGVLLVVRRHHVRPVLRAAKTRMTGG